MSLGQAERPTRGVHMHVANECRGARRLRRGAVLPVSIVVFAAAWVVQAGPPQAWAASTSCSFSTHAHVVTVTINSNFALSVPVVATVTRTADSAGHIQVNGVSCGTATVTNTDRININDATPGRNAKAVIDESNGLFEPGFTAESVGFSEIEFALGLGDGADTLEVIGTPGNDSIRHAIGSSLDLIDLDQDSDNDIDETL